MFTIVWIAMAGAGLWLIYLGIEKRHKTALVAGPILVLLPLCLAWYLDFYSELLWFDALDFNRRFWVVFLTRVGLAALSGLLSLTIVWGLTKHSYKKIAWIPWVPRTLALLTGIRWGAANWDTVLAFMNQVPGSMTDPIFAKNSAFYLFALPFYDAVQGLLLLLTGLSLATVFVSLFVSIDRKAENIHLITKKEAGNKTPGVWRRFYISLAAVMVVVAWGYYLKRYHLLYSTLGAVTGAGWTDVHIRSWIYAVMGILALLSILIVIIAPVRNRIEPLAETIGFRELPTQIPALAAAAIFLLVSGVLILSILPGILQQFRVEPNEITFERPFIEHNIRFTRHGFNLHDIRERQYPASGQFTRQMVKDNPTLFSNIRLWDWRALNSVYKQFQEIRLYYEFQDVDIDRYTMDGDYRQVMVSARELNLDNLPEKSRTFVNKRFKYTHGYGITMTNVNEFTRQGLPNLLIKDIPPVSTSKALSVKEPRIYYGETTTSHVIVNTKEKEFDYPSGERNVYNRYSGNGGVQLKNFWRKLVYAHRFDGLQLLLSGYPKADSRIQFRRHILDRVKAVAPFLTFDHDPYIVLADGRLQWIIDAYTTSDRYPYSERFKPDESRHGIPGAWSNEDPAISSFYGVNYIRNSVKCVVDAYNGSVDFYIFDTEDPLIRVWQRIFPNLFKSRADMPGSLVNHIRYPSGMLLAQGLVYAKYHMTDPAVFYNQEDLWIRATEKYYNQVIPVRPYYILWKPPGSKQAEFSLILPFTPKERQVSIGWIAGLCDPGSYGKMIAYQFPKEKRVLGPQQVETKIDQDSYLSGQLTLWDQRGSNVIRGNVLAIPVAGTIIYVEPIYLQAETAAYPELRLVAVMHNDDLSYATTFDKALDQLFDNQQDRRIDLKSAAGTKGEPKAGRDSFDMLIQQADQAFNRYLESLGNKEYDQALQSLEQLETSLQQLKRRGARQ